MNNKSRIVAKKASQHHAVCSDPNYALQSGIIGVKLGAGLLGRPKISLSATYLNTCCRIREIHNAESEKYILHDQNICDKSKKFL